MDHLHYPLSYFRRKTRVVRVGDLLLGGDSPIRIQSMLTSATSDIVGCMKEIRALNEVGCELIRLSVPSGKDLEAIGEIRRRMQEEGIATPLVADVHFSPRLAVEACEFFEKVRINPGNYTDVSKNTKETSRVEFIEGRERLREAIVPLVRNLIKYDRSLRIGVNHGSLSTRMIEQYGDSPGGMVESALEAVALFEEQGFNRLVVSLKSSNPIIVQKAYRLMAARQSGEEAVPFHLGVTEAGEGTMGRIKAITGIGVLLRDGLGDTIRVSLTEESIHEIAYARELLKSLEELPTSSNRKEKVWSRNLDHRRVVNRSLSWSNSQIGGASSVKIGMSPKMKNLPANVRFEPDFEYRINDNGTVPGSFSKPLFLSDQIAETNRTDMSHYSAILFHTDWPVDDLRCYYKEQENSAFPSLPVGLLPPLEGATKNALRTEIELATALSEGLVDFLLIPDSITSVQLEKLICLLQATRSKVLLPEYIVCPSCGRTLFDLQSTTKKIKSATSHLKGIKIGIMGCIVNGPGEMADADFGYIGSGAGKVDLYLGQKRVERGIEEGRAVDALIRLIKKHNRWIEPNF